MVLLDLVLMEEESITFSFLLLLLVAPFLSSSFFLLFLLHFLILLSFYENFFGHLFYGFAFSVGFAESKNRLGLIASSLLPV